MSVLSIETIYDFLSTKKNSSEERQLFNSQGNCFSHHEGRQTTISCPGNKPCVHNSREVRFLKTSCSEFLTSGLKYQHLSPPSPEIDYVPLRVEIRDQNTRALLKVKKNKNKQNTQLHASNHNWQVYILLQNYPVTIYSFRNTRPTQLIKIVPFGH